MSRLYMRAPVPPFHNADGTALANSTTLTSISPAPDIIPAQATMLDIGTELELEAHGEFSTTGVANLTLGFYWGAAISGGVGTVLATPGAIGSASGAAAFPWQLHYRGRIRTIGTSGTIKGQGFLLLGTALTSFTTAPLPATAAARTVTIDTTVGGAKVLQVGATWGTASASNTVTCYDLSVDITN